MISGMVTANGTAGVTFAQAAIVAKLTAAVGHHGAVWAKQAVRRVGAVGAIALVLSSSGAPVSAAEKNGYQVSPFVGSFSTGVPITVPAYHGIEPRLALTYSSEGRNGLLGLGWSLSGFSQILGKNEMFMHPGTGTLVATLDGQDVLACPPGSSYPSCASGGTHYSRKETYLKILRVDEDHWTVFGKDGTQTKFTSLGLPGDYTWKLGQSQTIDTHGNAVNYTWWNPDGGIGHHYPSTATYNGYTVEFLYETRPDPIYSIVRYYDARIANRRLKTIKVKLSSGTLIRAYKLTYSTAPQSGKSLLTSVQQFGKDATFDGTGMVTGGTSLPAQTFAYTADGAAPSILPTLSAPAAFSTEAVQWRNLVNAAVVSGVDGGLIRYTQEPSDGAGASSTKSISTGNGFFQFTVNSQTGGIAGFNDSSDTSTSLYEIDFAWRATPSGAGVWENGVYRWGAAVAENSVLKIEVLNGTVRYLVNGSVVYTSTKAPAYPLVVDATVDVEWGFGVPFGTISGSLTNVAFWCSGTLSDGDVNGDGRTDQICMTGNWPVTVSVSLGTATGFALPTTWVSTNRTTQGGLIVADFTGDGKADLLALETDTWEGRYFIRPSTGTAFGPEAAWGTAQATNPSTWTPEYCSGGNGAYLGPAGDFNGDGKADIACIYQQGGEPAFLVGFSTGSGFTSLHSSACGVNPTLKRMDFNGDGMDDLFCSSVNPDRGTVYSLQGGYLILELILPRDTSFCTAGSYWTGDVNGDGRSEMGCKYGNVLMGGAYNNLANQGPFCLSGQTLVEDLDGDGAAEWICNNPGTGADDIQIRKWTGTGFGAAANWIGGFCAGTVRAGDYNGDGKTDLQCGYSVAIGGTPKVRGDLMYSVSNGIGGSTLITYAPSTDYSSLNGASTKHVISSISQNDGRGGIDVTSFAYENSFEDDKEKKWNGFSKVTTTHPKIGNETVGPKTITGYLVQGPAAGSVDWVESRNGLNRLLSYTKNTYVTSDVGNRQTSLLSMVENERYDGTTTGRCTIWPCVNGRRTKVTHAYDGTYGNLTTSVNFGDVDISGDEVTTSHSYSPNVAAYIVGLLASSSQFEGTAASGNMLTSSRRTFDGAASSATPPTKGDVTTSEVLLKEESRYLTSLTTYDARGNAISSTDATGKVVTATYETTYNMFPVSATNGAGEATTTAWDYLCGIPATTTDPNGLVTTFATDALCRPTTTTLSGGLGVVSTTIYTGLGNPTAQKTRVEAPGPDGSPSWSESLFDGFGRTYKTRTRGPSAAESIVTETSFDARGNLWGQKSPYYENAPSSAAVTEFEYDGFNRPVKTILPDGKTRLTEYPALAVDGLFQVISTNELGQSSTTKTNVFGQTRKQEKDTSLYGTLVTTRNYDILGRMTSLVDPAGNTWSYTFDSLGRNLTKVDPDAGTWTYAYDDVGRVASQQDAKGQTTTLEYDAAGRAQYKRTRPSGGASGTITETVETAYGTSTAAFNKGRVTTLVRKNAAGAELNGKLAFEYDALGRVVKQTRTIDGTPYVVERNYDTAGYLRGMKYPDNDTIGQVGGIGTALGYDGAGRLSTIPGILTSVTYNAFGAPVVQTNANGTTTTKTYDPDRFWLTDIDTTAPSLTIQNLNYTLNDAGMATAVDSDVTNEDWTYQYDALNRLTSSTNGTPANNQTWTYDNIGRIIGNSRVGSFTYPGVGNARPHAPTQISGGPLGLLNFAYDGNGNMQSGNGRTMVWDEENMITQVTANSLVTQFTYGPDGDRIKKTQGSTVIRYPFGDDYEIATNGTVTKYFNAGFGPIAKKVGSTLYWLHTDRLGSINATTDATGAELLHRSYRSFGELLGQTGTHAESLGYIGQRTDAETANGTTDDKGLTYLHARYYDSALGIFLSPDPAGADRNTYRYSFGDSVNFSDPSGLCGETVTGVDNQGNQWGPIRGEDCGRADFATFWWYFAHSTPDPDPRGPRDPRDPCSISQNHPRCTDRKEPPPECDKSDPNGPCYVPPTGPGCGQGFAAGGTCKPPEPEGCNPLMSCPNAPNATPQEREQLQVAQEALLAAIRDVPACGSLFGSSFVARKYLDGILYTFQDGGSNISGATHTPGRVGLYRPPGLFFQGGGGYWRSSWGDSPPPLLLGPSWQGSIVGHELLHEMGMIERDSFAAFGPFSPHMSLANGYLIANRCFGYGG